MIVTAGHVDNFISFQKNKRNATVESIKVKKADCQPCKGSGRKNSVRPRATSSRRQCRADTKKLRDI